MFSRKYGKTRGIDGIKRFFGNCVGVDKKKAKKYQLEIWEKQKMGVWRKRRKCYIENGKNSGSV